MVSQRGETWTLGTWPTGILQWIPLYNNYLLWHGACRQAELFLNAGSLCTQTVMGFLPADISEN